MPTRPGRGVELEGMMQLASFHPRYQFAGTEADDITNSTNRAPYPTLHLLREDSIDRAVEAFPEAGGDLRGATCETLEKLGHEGWDALGVGPARGRSSHEAAESAPRPRCRAVPKPRPASRSNC